MIKNFSDFNIDEVKEKEREHFERELNSRKKMREERDEPTDSNFQDIESFIVKEISNEEDYHLTTGTRMVDIDGTRTEELHIEFQSPQVGRVRIFKPSDTSVKGYFEINGKMNHADADQIRSFYHYLNQEIKQEPILALTEKQNKKYMQNYKLFENLQKARKILSDLKIPEDNPKFVELKKILANNPGYLGAFTKWLFEDHESLEQMEEVYKALLTISIDRPIESFKKMEELYDYIQSFEINKKVNQVINSLPSRSREYANEELKNLISLNIEYAKFLKDWYSKKGGRYKDSKSLVSDTKDYIKNLKGGFNLGIMLKKIEGLNVDVCISTPELLMVKCNDFPTSHKIGSPHWCISTSKSYWDSYVNEFTQQYFIYDFTKDISDKRHMIGATIAPSGKISYAHFADDSGVRDMTYFDDL